MLYFASKRLRRAPGGETPRLARGPPKADPGGKALWLARDPLKSGPRAKTPRPAKGPPKANGRNSLANKRFTEDGTQGAKQIPKSVAE